MLPHLLTVFSTNITNGVLAVCGLETAPHLTPLPRCHRPLTQTGTDGLTELRAAALTHYALTQAEEKIVPDKRLSFRQELKILVTYNCVLVNDVHCVK